MDWSFLDKVDKNFLYLYARDLSENQTHYMQLYAPEDTGDEDRNDMLRAELKRKSSFYIIWFVFRYVLGCETLEEAQKHTTDDVIKRYKLMSIFTNRYIYIGVYGINEVYLYKHKPNENDMGIILEILYNRYDFFEQLQCFIDRTEGSARTTRNRCIRTLKETRELLESHPEYMARFLKPCEEAVQTAEQEVTV